MVSTLVSIYFGSSGIWHTIKIYKLHKIADCWFRDVLNFDFLEKVLGLVLTPHFVYDF